MAENSTTPVDGPHDSYYETALAQRIEREFRTFARLWCQNPWNAEQAAKHGEGWLRACFNSAALAYAGGREEEVAREAARLRAEAQSGS